MGQSFEEYRKAMATNPEAGDSLSHVLCDTQTAVSCQPQEFGYDEEADNPDLAEHDDGFVLLQELNLGKTTGRAVEAEQGQRLPAGTA